MFKKMWKTPVFINPILDRAQKEINNAVIRGRKDHNDPNIWLKVQMDQQDQLPHIYVTEDGGKVYEDLLLADLVADDEVQNQVKSLPSFVRKMINFDKIVAALNRAIGQSLGNNKYAKVTQGNKTAKIDLHQKDGDVLVESNIALKNLIDITKM
ncbi:MAG: hypothetical protein MK212_05575 [Saprospiraceae bacterium]|nr:hypothetical protein [Saprospiraceae bacterium]